MEIQDASTAPSKCSQLRNLKTVRFESRKITTQPVEIDNRKSKDIAFVVHAGMDKKVRVLFHNSDFLF